MKLLFVTIIFWCFISLGYAVTCPNCLNGCGNSSSCFNNTCREGFYGSGCRKVLPILSDFALENTIATPCSLRLAFTRFASTPVLIPRIFYYAFKKGDVSNPTKLTDFTTINQTVNCSSTKCISRIQISLESAIYTFGAYFVFNDVDVYEQLLSKIATVKGSCTTIITPKPTTKPAVTTTTTKMTVTKAPIVTTTKPVATGTVILSNPQVPQKSSDMAQVIFPEVTIEGTILLNLYYVALVRVGDANQNSNSVSRKKRAASLSCSPSDITGIPSSANFVYASNKTPTSYLDVGSGQSLSSLNCPNPALTPDSNYTVYSVVGSSNSFPTTQYWFSNTTFITPSSGLSPGIIALIAVMLILMLLIILFLLLWFCLYKKRRSKSYTKRPLTGIDGLYSTSHDKPHSYCHWTSISDRMHPRKIVPNTNKLTGVTYLEEFQQLPHSSESKEIFAQMTLPDNQYESISTMTMYRTRILLNRDDPLSPVRFSQNPQENSHYYIASKIDGYNELHDFLAADSPVTNQTVNDFWWLVYQENVGQIVTLTGPFEVPRYNTFWNSDALPKSELMITKKDEQVFKDFRIRIFSIWTQQERGRSGIEVKQYQYTGRLTSEGVPEDLCGFLEFYRVVDMGKEKLHGPQLVHEYGGGPSLSVIFIAYSILMQQLKTEDEVVVYKAVSHVKRARQLDLLSFTQYLFIYDLLFESRLGMAYNCEADDIENLKEYRLSSVYEYLRSFNIDYRVPGATTMQGYTRSVPMRNVAESLKLDSIYHPASIHIIPQASPLNYPSVWVNVLRENIEILVFLEQIDPRMLTQQTGNLRIQEINDEEDDDDDDDELYGTDDDDDDDNRPRGDTRGSGRSRRRSRVEKMKVEVFNEYSSTKRRSVIIFYQQGSEKCETTWPLFLEHLIKPRYRDRIIGLVGNKTSSVTFTAILNIAATYKKLEHVNFYLVIRQVANQNSLIMSGTEHHRLEQVLINWESTYGHYSRKYVYPNINYNNETKDFMNHSLKMIEEHYYPIENAHVIPTEK